MTGEQSGEGSIHDVQCGISIRDFTIHIQVYIADREYIFGKIVREIPDRLWVADTYICDVSTLRTNMEEDEFACQCIGNKTILGDITYHHAVAVVGGGEPDGVHRRECKVWVMGGANIVTVESGVVYHKSC